MISTLLKNKKAWLGPAITLLVVALVALGIYALWPKPDILTFSGLAQTKEIKNASRFGGRVLEVKVQEGDVVEAGQLLVVFDASELKAQLEEAEAALIQAKAKAKLLHNGADGSERQQAMASVQQAREKVNLLRHGARQDELKQIQNQVENAALQVKQINESVANADKLLAEGIISKKKYDDLKAQQSAAENTLQSAQAQLNIAKTGARPEEVNIARAQLSAAQAQYQQLARGAKPPEREIASATVAQAQSAVDALKSQMKETELRAPLSGVISILTVTPGELIQPGKPVFTVIDHRNLWTDIYVPESQLPMIQVGQVITAKANAYPKAAFAGKVIYINPKSEFVPSSGVAGAAAQSDEPMFRVKVALSNKDTENRYQLYPGMNLTISVPKAN